jgi:glycosyltransferase involved in cell wall biosynthesis
MAMSEGFRVCVVSPMLHGGGAEYQLTLLIEALRQKARHEIFFLAHHLAKANVPPGCTVRRIGHSERAPRFGYVTDFVPLYGALRRIAPQVIYQRVGCGYTGICAWYARRHNSRMIWHVAHDTDVMPESLDAGRNLLRQMLEKRSIEYGIRNADRIVVQTSDQAQLLEEHYGRRADQVVPNFQGGAGETIDKSGVLTVVWIANLKPWKQPEVFLRLAQSLRDLPTVHFVMVGEAPVDARSARWLRGLLAEIDGLPNLEFIGRRTLQEVNALLARAHVFVNTSVREGFPNTFIQSWLREAVVVSLQVNPDQVLDRERVGICAGGEAELQLAVRRLLLDSALREQYGKRARVYAQSRHSLRNAEILVALIDSCAARQGEVTE